MSKQMATISFRPVNGKDKAGLSNVFKDTVTLKQAQRICVNYPNHYFTKL